MGSDATPEITAAARCRHGISVGCLACRCHALEAALAECYRLSGADPDGAPASMLADHAIPEVRRMREERDGYAEAADALHDEAVKWSWGGHPNFTRAKELFQKAEAL